MYGLKPVPFIQKPVPSIQKPVPSILKLVAFILKLVAFILKPVPFILKPVAFILKPVPFKAKPIDFIRKPMLMRLEIAPDSVKRMSPLPRRGYWCWAVPVLSARNCCGSSSTPEFLFGRWCAALLEFQWN
jgi:hypothetical protein